MNQEEFKNEFVEALREKLYERGNEVNVSINNVEKMNTSYEAITVTPEGSNVGVNMNFEVFAEAYASGVPFNEIVEQVAGKVEAHISNMPEFDVAQLTDYEQMKDKLCMEVVAADRNVDLLAKVPHQEIEDMAVVYRFVMESSDEGRASILVTNDLLDKMGVTPEQLHADALENAPEIRPAVIQGMSEVIVGMMGEDAPEMFGIDAFPQDEMMYVASVPDKISGAGVIAYQEFMDQAAERLGGDFFILPSSIHEVLLVKDDGNVNFTELKNMVEEVNATQVAPEEKLTDSVYHYDSKDHIFELAEKFEARQQAKEADISSEKEEKSSVLGDLKAKKEEVATVLAESVAARLRENGFKCRVVEISVRDNELFSFTRQRKLDHATNVTREIAEEAFRLFQENYNWQKPIRSVGVRGADLVNDNYWEQIDLFSSVEFREKQMKVDEAVDDIRRRFGFYSVQRGLMYFDKMLSAVDAKSEHTVHPHGYFG